MDKMLFSYAVVFYIMFSSIVMFAQAGINCSNLTSVCPNRPVVLTCKAPLPLQWKSLDCTPKLFKDIPLHITSVVGTTIVSGTFIATVVEITKDKFVTTTLNFFPNCSYERQCRIRCEYQDTNGNSPDNKDCDINYEYISKCTWCRVNL